MIARVAFQVDGQRSSGLATAPEGTGVGPQRNSHELSQGPNRLERRRGDATLPAFAKPRW